MWLHAVIKVKYVCNGGPAKIYFAQALTVSPLWYPEPSACTLMVWSYAESYLRISLPKLWLKHHPLIIIKASVHLCKWPTHCPLTAVEYNSGIPQWFSPTEAGYWPVIVQIHLCNELIDEMGIGRYMSTMAFQFTNMFELTTKKTLNICITGPLWEMTVGFFSQKASNAVSFSMSRLNDEMTRRSKVNSLNFTGLSETKHSYSTFMQIIKAYHTEILNDSSRKIR